MHILRILVKINEQQNDDNDIAALTSTELQSFEVCWTRHDS